MSEDVMAQDESDTNSTHETGSPQGTTANNGGSNRASSMGNGAALNLVKDIPLTLSIELGRARMTLKQLLELDQGAVVELDRMVDEPLDILVNGTLVAHGEVVVIDDTFGVRLTDVATTDSAQVLGG